MCRNCRHRKSCHTCNKCKQTHVDSYCDVKTKKVSYPQEDSYSNCFKKQKNEFASEAWLNPGHDTYRRPSHENRKGCRHQNRCPCSRCHHRPKAKRYRCYCYED